MPARTTLLTAEQAAELLGVSSANIVRNYWRRGLIERAPEDQWLYKGRPMYTRASVEAYLESRPAPGNPRWKK